MAEWESGSGRPRRLVRVHSAVDIVLIPFFLVALSILARIPIERLIQGESPLLLFSLAVMASAWYGGMWAGLMATLLSMLGGRYFLLEPRFSLGFHSAANELQMGLLAVVGVGISLMVGSLHRARGQAFANEQSFQKAFENAAVGMALVGPDGRWLRVNQRLCEIVGYSEEEMLHLSFPELTYPADLDVDMAHRKLLTSNAVPNYALEKRYRHKDGSIRWVSLSVALLRDVDGHPSSFVKVIQDITSRKQVEDRLRNSESQFRQVSESIPQLAWTTRPDGMAEWFNHRWYEYTGQPEAKAIDIGWANALDPAHLAATVERWRHCVATGEPYEVEYRLRRHDGMMRWFLARGLPIRGDSGEVIRWFGTCTDIHDLRTSQEALEQARDDLQGFAWAASHDLQEPLRMVLTYTQLLDRQYGDRLDDRAREYMRNSIAGARRMEGLLAALREYWTTAAQEFTTTPMATPMGPAVDMVIDTLSKQIEESGASVRVEGELPLVGAEQAAMVQLLQNLVSNAIKFRHPDRPLVIKFHGRKLGPVCQFCVEDNGVGIDPQYHSQIFKVFKRLHTQAEVEGSGIGLALCEAIVRRHGGHIWVESVPGAGARFYFALPCVEPSLVGA